MLHRIATYRSKPFWKHALWATHCPFCGQAILRTMACCDDCLEKLPELICAHSVSVNPPFVRAVQSVYYYDDEVRQAIWSMKFHHDSDAGRVLGEALGRMVKSRYAKMNLDAVVAVPLTRRKRLRRGYNQCDWLAREVAKQTGLRVLPDVVRKLRDTPDQHDQEMEDRADNLRGVFGTVHAEVVQDKNILLIDDVYTSGWTVSYCAEALMRAGAKAVYVATVARAVPSSKRKHRQPVCELEKTV